MNKEETLEQIFFAASSYFGNSSGCPSKSARGDESRRMYFKYGGYWLKNIKHKHFGDEPVDVFVIRFYEEPTVLDMALFIAGMAKDT